MLQSMPITLIHVHHLEILYLCYGVEFQSGVIWGHWGQKVILIRTCYDTFMLYSMTTRLMHVQQLETLDLCYGVKCQSGVIWDYWGQKVIFTKNAITRPLYIV